MRASIPAPPYAPFAGFRAPRNALAVAAAIAAGGIALLLLERWLSGRRRPVDAPAEQEVASPPSRHMEQLLDEAVEETFPASDPIAVHIE